MEIVDLSELLGDEKKVRLEKGGKVFILPPDLPAELYLRIVKFAREQPEEADMIEALYGQLLELFRYKQPNLESLPVSIQQCVLAVGAIYGDGGEPADAPPPPRTRGGASSKSARTKSRS